MMTCTDLLLGSLTISTWIRRKYLAALTMEPHHIGLYRMEKTQADEKKGRQFERASTNKQ